MILTGPPGKMTEQFRHTCESLLMIYKNLSIIKAYNNMNILFIGISLQSKILKYRTQITHEINP